MKKINNLKLEETSITKSMQWGEIESKIMTLLKESDFIFLEDSEVLNKDEWKDWRKKVRRVKDLSQGVYGKAVALLRNLEDEKPKLIKEEVNQTPDITNLSQYKKDLISMVKRKHNRELMKSLVECEHSDLFSWISGEGISEENKKIANSIKNDMDRLIKMIEVTDSIKELQKIFREYYGYRH